MNKTTRERLFTRPFTLLLIAQATFGYSFSVYYLLPKFLSTQLNAGPADIGLTTTVHAFTIVIALFVSGHLISRLGRKYLLALGACIMAVSSFGMAFVQEIGLLLYFLRTVQGAAFAMSFVAGATLTVDLAPSTRVGQSIGLFGVAMLGMGAIAPMISEPLADLHGWNWTFASAGIAAGLCTLLIQLINLPSRIEASAKISDFREAMTYQGLGPIYTVIAIVGAAFGAMLTFQTPFALELGMTAVRSFFIAHAAAAVCVRIFLGSLIDRIGYRRVSVFSLGLYVLTVFSMAFLQEGGLSLIGGLFGLAHGLFYPAFNAFAVSPLSIAERGKVMASFQAWFSLGFAVGTLILGYLADFTNYPTVFFTSGTVTLLALLLLIVKIKVPPVRKSN